MRSPSGTTVRLCSQPMALELRSSVKDRRADALRALHLLELEFVAQAITGRQMN